MNQSKKPQQLWGEDERMELVISHRIPMRIQGTDEHSGRVHADALSSAENNARSLLYVRQFLEYSRGSDLVLSREDTLALQDQGIERLTNLAPNGLRGNDA